MIIDLLDGSAANFHAHANSGMISPVIDGGLRGGIMISFQGAHFEKDIILTCVRWYVASPLSYRQLEELMQEHGVPVDHATVNRWVLKYSPQLGETFHHRKRPVWLSWRMDETYIRVRGQWRSLYRAGMQPARRLTSS
jgi:transposase-like protein